MQQESKITRVFQYLLLAVFMFLLLFPIYWQFIMSVSISGNVLSSDLDWLMPKVITTVYYEKLFFRTDFFRFFFNSTYIAVVTTLLTLVLSAMGGYSLGRIRFTGRKLVGRLILFTYVIPSVLLLVPLFTFIVNMNLLNTKASLVLSYMTFSLPFCLWMLRGFFASLPKGIEEAALIDGCSIFGSFLRVILPLSAPGLVAAAMFTFMLSWNEYLFALVFITNNAAQTLPIGIVTNFFNSIMTPEDWCTIMAAAVLVSIPVYFLFIFLQKYLVSGLAAGAVKE